MNLLCLNLTVYYVYNTTYINQQLINVKILATCFSYSELSSGQKQSLLLKHSVIVHLWDPVSFTFYIIGQSDCMYIFLSDVSGMRCLWDPDVSVLCDYFLS